MPTSHADPSARVLVVMTAFALLGCPTTGADKADKVGADKAGADKAGADKAGVDKAGADEVGVKDPVVPLTAGCTIDHTPQKVDGASLWSDIPDATAPANCNFHRFAYNNFLYMVGGTVPRFMTEMASTVELGKTGTWPTTPSLLATRSIRNIPSNEFENAQADGGFQLVDVGEQTVLYDIRINKTMWDSINANTWNTQDGFNAAQTAFKANSQTGGIWLPPNTGGTDPSIQSPSGDDSIEMKTAWRNYGANAADCPSAIMFCTQDSDGNTLGLVGMHLVQKTPTRGEWVWASFEHVGNAPDCSPTLPTTQKSSNPLQQNPRDPTNPSATINVNPASLASATGWSIFNFTSYTAAGGNGTICDFSKGTPAANFGCTVTSGTSQCNGNPNPSGDGKTFVQTNVCRTDAIPDHSTAETTAAVCKSATDPDENLENGNNVACITQSVLDSWPAGLDNRWKYYMLAGTEWLDATSVQTVGCFNIVNTATSLHSYTCPQTPPATPAPTTGSVHLANTTMETWIQAEACITYEKNGAATSIGAADCFSCHQPNTDLTHTLPF